MRLIHRSTRTFAVTESGRDYYAHCVAMLVEAEAAEEAILRSKSEPQGRVVISCPPALAAMGFNETIARFAAEHPKVQIQVESTNRRVDPLTENIDIALRVRFPPLGTTGWWSRSSGTVPSAWWRARTWRPGYRRRLLSMRCRHCPASTCLPRITSTAGCWRRRPASMPKYAIRRGSSARTGHDAAGRLAGCRCGPASRADCQEALQDGRLIELFSEHRPKCGIVHAVFASRRGLLPAVRGLLDVFETSFKELSLSPDSLYCSLNRTNSRIQDH